MTRCFTVGVLRAVTRLSLLVATATVSVNLGSASAQVMPELVADFDGTVAFGPYIGGGVVTGSDGALYGVTYRTVNTGCGAVYKVVADGTLTVLHEFQGHSASPPDGCNPVGELVEAPDGHLYGTTSGGGANADATFPFGTGTIFKISKDGTTYSVVHSFAPYDPTLSYWPEGAAPLAGLTMALDGNLYGTTSSSGAGSVGGGNCTSIGGTIFRLSPTDPTGTPTIIHAFSFAQGCTPTNLKLASDGSLLGTTIQGGDAGADQALGGTIFKITTTGSFTRLAVFPGTISSGTPYGTHPYSAPVEASDGTLYGTTVDAGPSVSEGAGTVYKCVPSGFTCMLGVVHDFTNNEDGGYPFAGLVRGSNGIFYGTTSSGGTGAGVLFQVTSADAFARLYSFNASNPSFDGSGPFSGLFEASPGIFYGTTSSGGSPSRGGTVFRFTVGTPTATGLQISQITTVFGQGVTLTATVSSNSGHPTGQVEFFDGAASLGTSTLSNGVATLATTTLGVGTHSLSARYLGEEVFLPSTSPSAAVTVNRASSTATVVSSPNPSSRKQTVTFTATVAAVAPGSGTATGQVQFLEGKKKLGSALLVNGVATLPLAFNSMGTHDVTAAYAGDGNFVGSTSPVYTHTVSR